MTTVKEALAKFNDGSEERRRAEMEARLHLIAAAPDLLAVLSGLMEVLEDAGFETEIMTDARAAIAKAEGVS